MQRQLNRLIVIFLVMTAILVALNSFGWNNEKDTPAALKNRLADIVSEQSEIAEEIKGTPDNSLTKEQWEDLMLHNKYGAGKAQAIVYAIIMCERFSKGSYCEDANKDLGVLESELREMQQCLGNAKGLKS